MAKEKEYVCVTYTAPSGLVYRITRSRIDGLFRLYRQTPKDKWEYTKNKSDNPLDLEQFIEQKE